jgi:cyclophilin family peptidyl-prolyl cis-trans isomerase
MQLFADKTPITVTNFVTLAEENFYDSVIFHRVVPGFVIQGGDPTGTGSGGKSIYDGKPYVNEIVPGLGHDSAGVVAMANRGPNTNTSQFYITLAAVPELNGNYTVFGKVINGMDVVNKIGSAETQPPYDRPVDPVAMEKVTIERRPKK